jgi:prepilin-type N-terminal cleavage/methylation domain-containing protein
LPIERRPIGQHLWAVGKRPAISVPWEVLEVKKFCCKTRGLRGGFSLLEVLFTVLILAVLAAVAVPLYSNTKASAAVSACKSNVQALANAESKYKFENGSYTTTASNLVSGYGVAAVPVCPGDGSAYTLTASGNTLTITCGSTLSGHSANTITLN